jgi:hypothetical protein
MDNTKEEDNASKDFSPEASIRLIQSMIDKTRLDVVGGSRYFLLWGWCTFAAITGQFLLKAVFHSVYHPVVWWITLPCLLISWYWSRDGKRRRRAKTYVNEMMRYLWSALTLAYFAISMIFLKIGWEDCYPFYIVLYGIGTFVSGRILRFNLFVWGGIASFILAAAAIWFTFDYQALFAAAAIFISYIIPGHLFRIKSKKDGRRSAGE